jgi:hypothetical protein
MSMLEGIEEEKGVPPSHKTENSVSFNFQYYSLFSAEKKIVFKI